MNNDYAAFSQNLLKLTTGNRIADVEEDCVQDDTSGKMNALASTAIRFTLSSTMHRSDA